MLAAIVQRPSLALFAEGAETLQQQRTSGDERRNANQNHQSDSDGDRDLQDHVVLLQGRGTRCSSRGVHVRDRALFAENSSVRLFRRRPEELVFHILGTSVTDNHTLAVPSGQLCLGGCFMLAKSTIQIPHCGLKSSRSSVDCRGELRNEGTAKSNAAVFELLGVGLAQNHAHGRQDRHVQYGVELIRDIF